MTEAEAFDFPFVSELPKREKTKFRKIWDTFQALRALTAEKGTLVPSSLAAKILGVSRQRVDQLIQEGRLECHSVDGHNFISEASFVEFAKQERKTGRPPKSPSLRDCAEVTKEILKKY